MEQIQSAHHFTKLNLCSVYNLVRTHKKDILTFCSTPLLMNLTFNMFSRSCASSLTIIYMTRMKFHVQSIYYFFEYFILVIPVPVFYTLLHTFTISFRSRSKNTKTDTLSLIHSFNTSSQTLQPIMPWTLITSNHQHSSTDNLWTFNKKHLLVDLSTCLHYSPYIYT